MASPRVRNRRAVSEMLRLPAAANAEYSPSECPATNEASRATEKPASPSSTRIAASDTAIRAGWAFSVSCKTSAGPLQMMSVSFSPSAASTSSNTARAAGKASARALPIPTAWEPCPGNVNAAVIGAPSFEWGRKTLTKAGMSSRGAESPGPAEATERSLEAARLLVAANLFPSPGAACAAHDVARPVLMVWPRRRQPQHGGVVGLHLHAVRIAAFTEYAVDARQVVAG